MDKLMSFGYLQLLRKEQKKSEKDKNRTEKREQILGKVTSRLFMLFLYSDWQAAVYSNASLACSLTVVLRDDGLPHWQ